MKFIDKCKLYHHIAALFELDRTCFVCPDEVFLKVVKKKIYIIYSARNSRARVLRFRYSNKNVVVGELPLYR
jgi:hypothetical protein